MAAVGLSGPLGGGPRAHYLLTRQAWLPIVRAMYGLNQICGICREIIR